MFARAAQTSELLACFIVGCVFSSSVVLKRAWPANTESLVRWGTILFFAATIGCGHARCSMARAFFLST